MRRFQIDEMSSIWGRRCTDGQQVEGPASSCDIDLINISRGDTRTITLKHLYSSETRLVTAVVLGKQSVGKFSAVPPYRIVVTFGPKDACISKAVYKIRRSCLGLYNMSTAVGCPG